MAKLPKELKLTSHARQRLIERRNSNVYNSKNLMKSACKWYGKDDLSPDSALYAHCLYVCRKSKQLCYLTDGVLEVIYNRSTKEVLTIMEVKEKFLPITQHIKPSYLKQIKVKKEKKKMRKKLEIKLGTCPDCDRSGIGVTTGGMYAGLCDTCKLRKQNAKGRGKEYIPYNRLSTEEKLKIDARRKWTRTTKEDVIVDDNKPENTNNHINTDVIHTNINTQKTDDSFNPLSDRTTFVSCLRECGCEIPENSLERILDVLTATNTLKDIMLTITNDEGQESLLDLENMLNVAERKLQHNWEYNGFQEVDDIKFKGFLVWRRMLKGSIVFWKKLYQTGTMIKMKEAWDAYMTDPNEKQLMAGDRPTSILKRFQITTDSISTIFNTRRPFTRVFYAVSRDDAYVKFLKWMSDRQLHEDKSKTTIVELSGDGEDGRDI